MLKYYTFVLCSEEKTKVLIRLCGSKDGPALCCSHTDFLTLRPIFDFMGTEQIYHFFQNSKPSFENSVDPDQKPADQDTHCFASKG